ncbi:hypothetical protein BE11_03355 [Sorangium cellulosum]|nr:hypothetical protein BE11_03355 [Sorangium cellulosum]
MMLQTFGAGCTAQVEVGDDSGKGGGREAGPDDDADGTGSSASSGGAGGSFSTGGGSPVGSGGESGSTSGSSSVGTGGGFSTGSGPEPATAGAIALFRSQFPEPSNDSGSSSAGSGGSGTAPNDLFILFGAPVSSCADPSGTTGCGNWQLGIAIPPALQVPGIIDLSAPDVLFSSYVVSRPDRGDGECWWGEGSFRSGTMEIVSIDAAEVVVRLSGTDTEDLDANGEYTAARCP